jgi:Uncharacterised protein family (UPF0236)
MVSARTPYLAHLEEVHLNPTTDAARTEDLVTTMSERMTTLTRTLANWMQEQPHSLAEVEEHVVRLLKELGATLIADLCSLAASCQPSPSIACSCGQQALYQRERKAQVTTLLGPISIWRSYYLCPNCGVGQHPLDAQLQFCAGSRSSALDELLALLGATQDSFAEAAAVLERLTLIHLSPNSVRDATEQLGALLLEQQAQPLTEPQSSPAAPALSTTKPKRLYITMDGVLAHLHERGYSEIKVGCCYHTHSRVSPKRPERLEIRAHSASYVSALEQAQNFGWRLWQEALRRGLLTSDEVVVLGDGAHWIWNIAERHFPAAIQILDWYHASEYIWNAASAIWGAASSERNRWARCQLDRLWEGRVEQVLVELQQHLSSGEVVEAAVSYYSEHRGRMDYAHYRARGLQIGSGSVESACKQLVTARLKQAGMIWNASGAEAVAMVRAWLKSERWEEALALRGVRKRGYQRKQADQEAEKSQASGQIEQEQASEPIEPSSKAQQQRLPAEVLSVVQAELAEQRGKNVWGKTWSVRRQRELAPQTQQQKPAIAA